MGNNTVGRAMGKTAQRLIELRTTETAIDLLDAICGPYRGYDAEFEAEDPNRPGFRHPDYACYDDPSGPVGLLITEAFGEPGCNYIKGWPDDEELVWAWCDGPMKLFRDRYQFC